MKKIIAMCLLLTLMASLTACSSEKLAKNPPYSSKKVKTNEEQGVPYVQLESDILESERYPANQYSITNCTHNVDTTVHQDNVIVEYYRQSKYMRTDCVKNCIYQYDRSTDIWSLISMGNGDYTYVLPDSLVGTTWEDTYDTVFSGIIYYSVTVDAINLSDTWLRFSYDITWKDKNYTGVTSLQYGEFVLPHGADGFRVTFDPNEGISISK